jgi:hypothetical protein
VCRQPKFLLSDQLTDWKGKPVKELRFHPLSHYPEYMEADAFVDEQSAKVVSEMTMIEF